MGFVIKFTLLLLSPSFWRHHSPHNLWWHLLTCIDSGKGNAAGASPCIYYTHSMQIRWHKEGVALLETSLSSLRLSTQLGALFFGKKSLSFLKKRVNELLGCWDNTMKREREKVCPSKNKSLSYLRGVTCTSWVGCYQGTSLRAWTNGQVLALF